MLSIGDGGAEKITDAFLGRWCRTCGSVQFCRVSESTDVVMSKPGSYGTICFRQFRNGNALVVEKQARLTEVRGR